MQIAVPPPELVRGPVVNSKALLLAPARVARDWRDRHKCRPLLVEAVADRAAFTDRTFAAAADP
ncbi:hypothetical protein LBMAG56_53960 [Verrucomicrobiota bacterium]|nr:hypothetical protein LBMAG56_53960 [Verrucomicrobiota bacterium]